MSDNKENKNSKWEERGRTDANKSFKKNQRWNEYDNLDLSLLTMHEEKVRTYKSRP